MAIQVSLGPNKSLSMGGTNHVPAQGVLKYSIHLHSDRFSHTEITVPPPPPLLKVWNRDDYFLDSAKRTTLIPEPILHVYSSWLAIL